MSAEGEEAWRGGVRSVVNEWRGWTDRRPPTSCRNVDVCANCLTCQARFTVDCWIQLEVPTWTADGLMLCFSGPGNREESHRVIF